MNKNNVKKHILQNGLTVLVYEKHDVPSVCMQLWYNIGSKHEKDSDRGIAHMIEHMIFKGTKNLPEGAVDTIVYNACGSCNAFTSYDYTAYLFDIPSVYFQYILPVMADCMENCIFDQEYLNSELKAVIQELKMYNDEVVDVMVSDLMRNIFVNHPYGHPVIGYKNNIWNFTTEQLMAFYKQYYCPKNALLTIVGDVNFEECIKQVEKHFAGIKNDTFKAPSYCAYNEKDILVKQSKFYRPLEQSHYMMAWRLLPLTKENDFGNDVLTYIVAKGRGSRLYKKLVHELNLVADVDCFVYGLYDYSVFFIYFQPFNSDDSEKIKNIIIQEVEDLKKDGFTDQELERGLNKTYMDNISIFEANERIARKVSFFYLFTQDEHAWTYALSAPKDEVKKNIIESLQHINFLSYSEVLVDSLKDTAEKAHFDCNQLEKDTNDNVRLNKIVRSHVQEKRADFNFNIDDIAPKGINFPVYETYVMKNGLTIHSVEQKESDKIEIGMQFKVRHFFDPKEKAGRLGLTFDLMEEGTKNYSGNTFGEALESLGIEFDTSGGHVSISCLRNVFEKAIIFLQDYLIEPEFSVDAFNRIIQEHLVEIDNFWDDSAACSLQLLRELVYRDHGYAQNPSGTKETVKNMLLDDLKKAWKEFCTPSETIVVVVGNIDMKNIITVFEKYLGHWNGEQVADFIMKAPMMINAGKKEYRIMQKDQSVIAMGGLSVERFNKYYDPLLLLDQVFGGGVLHSMNSQLFALREKTGLFYAINGSLISGCSDYPGMSMIRAITSPEFVDKACSMIHTVLQSVLENVDEKKLNHSKKIVINHLSALIETQANIISSICFLHKYKLNRGFFNNRHNDFNSITKQQVFDAFNIIKPAESMVTLIVGRKEVK